MKKFNIGKMMLTATTLLLSSTMLFAHGQQEQTNTNGVLDKNIKATLSVACFKSNVADVYKEMDMEGMFQKLYPNVNIEIEQFKDASSYNNDMKIRASANQLPDIMLSQLGSFNQLQPFMIPLNDLIPDVIANNIAASTYAIDQKVYAIPREVNTVYLLYWDDLLKKAGIDHAPTTWPEYVADAIHCQEFYGKNDQNFCSVSIGAKDVWPTFPYVEFMPMTTSGNGNVWNEAAESDTPFVPGNPIYESYKQSYQLFNSIACGRDPLGVSPDQSVGLFEQKESVFHNASPGGALAIIKDLKGNTKGLKAIHIPSRMTQDQPYRRISEANNFLNISQSSHNPQLAAAFLKFYFSDDFYPEFIEKCATEPTMKGVKTAINPILAAADGEEIEPVWMAMFNDKYTAIRSYAKFDISSVASNFFIQDYDFEACMKKWNSAWADARKNLGYSK